jgi:hypothetical protein
MADIIRKRGDTYPIEFIVTGNGVPIDISTASFVLTVDPSRAPTSAATNLFALTGVVTNGPAGAVKFTPTPSQVDRVGNFFYDVQMVDGTGAIRTVQAAKFNLAQDITK